MTARARLMMLGFLTTASVASAQMPLPTPTPIQKTPNPAPSVFRLRNAAAADVCSAIKTFVVQQNWKDVVITPEPVSNTLLVAGDASQVKQVTALVNAMDQQPTCFNAQMMFVRVPARFAESVGLGQDDESSWMLSARETRMLLAAVRKGRESGEVEIISRPQMSLVENQTGAFQVGDGNRSLGVNATPKLSSDNGTVLLRLDAQLSATTVGGQSQVRDSLTLQTTGSIPLGSTMVVRGMSSANHQGVASEILVVTTITKVEPQQSSPGR